MLKTLMVFFTLLLAACQPKPSTAIDSSIDTAANSDNNYDAIRRALQRDNQVKMEAIKEPDIQGFNREVFRFRYHIAFGDELFIRVERLEDSTFLLTSKYFSPISRNPGFTRSSIPFHSFPVHFTENPKIDTVGCFHFEQKLDKKDWVTFRSLLNGSYYWAFQDVIKSNGFIDGGSLKLESMSILPGFMSEDELCYHENFIASPIRGSFTEAFQFLEKKSLLARKLGTFSFAPMFSWNHIKIRG